MGDDPSSDQHRDEANLRAVRSARDAGDAVGEREALGRLLAPYYDWARSIAVGKLVGVPNQTADAEAVAHDVMQRLVKAVRNKVEFDGPFHAIAKMNMYWALKDYWRAVYREQADSVDPDVLAGEFDREDKRTAAESDEEAFDGYLQALTEKQRELVRDRILFDLSPAEIMERRGMSREAVDTALHRAFKKLREDPRLTGVRKRRKGPA